MQLNVSLTLYYERKIIMGLFCNNDNEEKSILETAADIFTDAYPILLQQAFAADKEERWRKANGYDDED